MPNYLTQDFPEGARTNRINRNVTNQNLDASKFRLGRSRTHEGERQKGNAALSRAATQYFTPKEAAPTPPVAAPTPSPGDTAASMGVGPSRVTTKPHSPFSFATMAGRELASEGLGDRAAEYANFTNRSRSAEDMRNVDQMLKALQSDNPRYIFEIFRMQGVPVGPELQKFLTNNQNQKLFAEGLKVGMDKYPTRPKDAAQYGLGYAKQFGAQFDQAAEKVLGAGEATAPTKNRLSASEGKYNVAKQMYADKHAKSIPHAYQIMDSKTGGGGLFGDDKINKLYEAAMEITGGDKVKSYRMAMRARTIPQEQLQQWALKFAQESVPKVGTIRVDRKKFLTEEARRSEQMRIWQALVDRAHKIYLDKLQSRNVSAAPGVRSATQPVADGRTGVAPAKAAATATKKEAMPFPFDQKPDANLFSEKPRPRPAGAEQVAPLKQGQPAAQRAPVAPAPPGSVQVPKTMSGQGTAAQPFRASVQKDVEWFKNSAPDGTHLDTNKGIYEKRAGTVYKKDSGKAR
jgi:hypothetical protein